MLPLYALLLGIIIIMAIFTVPTIYDDWKKSRTKQKHS